MRRVASVVLLGAALSISSFPASAADLPVKAPLFSPVPAAHWTGLYFGVHVGAGWGTVESDINIGAVTFPISSHGTNGVLGGVQGGYNWQIGWAVLGVEGTWSASGIRGSAPCFIGLAVCTTKTDWMATFTGRIGGLVAGNTLVYVKGGAAYARDNYNFNLLGLLNTSASADRWGYVIGTGAEHKFTDRWSGLIEYNFNDFGKRSISFPVVGAVNVRDSIHVIKAGLNYKFW
jgi:outer membrane immunogenic protein